MTGLHSGRPPRWPLFAVAVALPLAAVGAALVSQHRFDIQACAWCVLQRVVFVAIAISALPGLVAALIDQQADQRLMHPQRQVQPLVQRLSAVLVLVLAACGAAAALWQHGVAAASQSCKLTLADRIVRGAGLDELWPAGFSAYASCADAAVRLLGVPYEFYSLALFTALAVVAALALRRRR